MRDKTLSEIAYNMCRSLHRFRGRVLVLLEGSEAMSRDILASLLFRPSVLVFVETASTLSAEDSDPLSFAASVVRVCLEAPKLDVPPEASLLERNGPVEGSLFLINLVSSSLLAFNSNLTDESCFFGSSED